MTVLTLPDIAAFAWFIGAWIAYSIVIEKTAKGRSSLNALMNRYRDDWMEQLLARDMRMVDAQVTAALQNGTAFFASTSLIAVGGALTLLRATEEVLPVMAVLPFGTTPSRELWDLKMMGLIIIFVYAFFKFAWSYRLFNYFAIMVGAAPPPDEKDTPTAQAFAHRAARLCADAGHRRHSGRDVATAVRIRRAQSLRSGRDLYAEETARPAYAQAKILGHSHQDGDSGYDHYGQRCRERGDESFTPIGMLSNLFIAG
jgi:uncharacterized membrane protein